MSCGALRAIMSRRARAHLASCNGVEGDEANAGNRARFIAAQFCAFVRMRA